MTENKPLTKEDIQGEDRINDWQEGIDAHIDLHESEEELEKCKQCSELEFVELKRLQSALQGLLGEIRDMNKADKNILTQLASNHETHESKVKIKAIILTRETEIKRIKKWLGAVLEK